LYVAASVELTGLTGLWYEVCWPTTMLVQRLFLR
jgi:hypothetical protein